MPWLARLWCRYMHGVPLWPMHGRYICRKCLREIKCEFLVPEEDICVKMD